MTAHELKSLLTEKTLWRLLFKSVLAVFSLSLVYGFGFHPVAVLAGIIVFAAMYLRETGERSLLKYSFLLLPLLFIFTAAFITPEGAWAAVLVFISFLLFFAVFGLANLFFRERFLVYGVLNTALLVSFFLFFFYLARGPENFWLLGPALFITTFFLLKEVLIFFGFSGKRRLALHAGALSLISLEFFHISQFLPLGFINAAAYIAIFLVLAKDLVVSSINGTLNFSFMMKQITLFLVLTIVVFAASTW